VQRLLRDVHAQPGVPHLRLEEIQASAQAPLEVGLATLEMGHAPLEVVQVVGPGKPAGP